MDQLLEAGELVFLALVDVGDAEFGGAFGDHVADARVMIADLDAVGNQAFQAKSVMHVERFQFAAVVRIVQVAVGQHAIDVEHRQADACGARRGYRQAIVEVG